MGLYPVQRQELRSVIEDHPVAPPKTPRAGRSDPALPSPESHPKKTHPKQLLEHGC